MAFVDGDGSAAAVLGGVAPGAGVAVPRGRVPRRWVRAGSVRVFHSARVRFPKFHFDPECEGFASTPLEARAERSFASLSDLARCVEGRPCRMCALEPVLRTLLVRSAGDVVAVTFASQPNPVAPDGPWGSHQVWADVTESGVARLRRVARVAGLSVCGSSAGPVAFGLVPVVAAEALRWNVRAFVLGPSPLALSPAAVETFWTLVSDVMPAQAAAEPAAARWRTAVALVS